MITARRVEVDYKRATPKQSPSTIIKQKGTLSKQSLEEEIARLCNNDLGDLLNKQTNEIEQIAQKSNNLSGVFVKKLREAARKINILGRQLLERLDTTGHEQGNEGLRSATTRHIQVQTDKPKEPAPTVPNEWTVVQKRQRKTNKAGVNNTTTAAVVISNQSEITYADILKKAKGSINLEEKGIS
ncbi:hypothetical protein RUM44_007998 [Polyplax serrata]|uniref:Uncharacterized protein n=1 Tax=Polyplax serrata TaxID=468196 RepID=A0ABR1B7J2_POLSC